MYAMPDHVEQAIVRELKEAAANVTPLAPLSRRRRLLEDFTWTPDSAKRERLGWSERLLEIMEEVGADGAALAWAPTRYPSIRFPFVAIDPACELWYAELGDDGDGRRWFLGLPKGTRQSWAIEKLTSTIHIGQLFAARGTDQDAPLNPRALVSQATIITRKHPT